MDDGPSDGSPPLVKQSPGAAKMGVEGGGGVQAMQPPLFRRFQFTDTLCLPASLIQGPVSFNKHVRPGVGTWVEDPTPGRMVCQCLLKQAPGPWVGPKPFRLGSISKHGP